VCVVHHFVRIIESGNEEGRIIKALKEERAENVGGYVVEKG
jgi:hypothetical protein